MKLYTINEDYINYLRKFSENVKYNKNETRPYIGIVLKINDHNYFAPLGSPKPKHIKMKEAPDFIKIDEGKLGVINLNNMIPVSLERIKKLNFSQFDKKYQELLKNQSRWIYENTKKIEKKSYKLYKIIVEKENTVFHKRSNDFKFLEEKAMEYNKSISLNKESYSSKPYNPFTGNKISPVPGEEEKLKGAVSSAWICEGDIKKYNIKIKENETAVQAKVFSLNANKKVCIKTINFYNIEQLNISQEIRDKFKQPNISQAPKPEKNISKEKDNEIER